MLVGLMLEGITEFRIHGPMPFLAATTYSSRFTPEKQLDALRETTLLGNKYTWIMGLEARGGGMHPRKAI